MADSTPTMTHEQCEQYENVLVHDDGLISMICLVNASDSDVTIQSADGVFFNLHCKNLEVGTGAFPGSEFKTHGERVYLTEPAPILEILFQFLYPKKHPDLKDLKFNILAQVAEAVEKYEVFSAMTLCEIRLT
jgi:hypothetical protein